MEPRVAAGWGGERAVVAVGWPPGGLQVGVGWAPGGGRTRGAGPRGGVRSRPPWPATPGPETAARAKVTQRPALTHSRDRPRGQARRGPPASGRAARPQFPRRAGPGRAGPGGGVAGRAARAAGRAAAGGARLPVEGDGALLPLALPVGAVRGRAADHHLGPQAAAPPPGSGPRLAAPRAGPPRGEGARRHGCGTWEPAPAAPVRQDGGARPAAPPPGRPAGPRRARVPQYLAGRSPRLAASGVGGGALGRRPRTAAWRAGPSVRQDGRAGGPAERRINMPSPALRRSSASASATPTGRCRGLRSARCRPPGSRARGPSPRRWAPPYAKMADVHFLPHFRPRPRPRPLGPDWPRQRPVASRCGTVGATPLSVGGRRGKMDAGEGLSGRGATRGRRPPGPSATGVSPSAAWVRDGRGAAGRSRRWRRAGRGRRLWEGRRGSDSRLSACLGAFSAPPAAPGRPATGPKPARTSGGSVVSETGGRGAGRSWLQNRGPESAVPAATPRPKH